jgi:hypothetical protein
MKTNSTNFKLNIFYDILCILLIFCVSFVYATVTTLAQTYDSLVYFEYYERISELGLFDFLIVSVDGVKILELGLYFFYWMLPSELILFDFIWINYIFIFLLSFLVFGVFGNKNTKKSFVFLFMLFIFFWYPVYQNVLWIWRNFIAVLFVIMYLRCSKSFVLLLSCFFHLASIFYSIILFFSEKISSFNLSRYKLTYLSFFIGLFFGFAFRLVFSSLDFLFSGSGNWLIEYSDSGFVGGVVSIYIYFIFLFLLFHFDLYKTHLSIVILLFFLSGISVAFLDNHFISNRINILTSLLVCSIIFDCINTSSRYPRYALSFFILLGFVPTVTSVVKYLNV